MKLSELVDLYKRVDPTTEAELMASLTIAPDEVRREFSAFLKGELARCIKLRSLGLRAEIEGRITMTRRVLDGLDP